MTKDQPEINEIIINFKKVCFISVINNFKKNSFMSIHIKSEKDVVNI